MKLHLPAALACAAALGAQAAWAGPMGFKGSWMAMGDLGANWQEVFVNYALTSRDAIGLSGLEMKSDDGRLTRRLGEATYTRLALRWNLPEAQANVWIVGGLGAVSGNDFGGSRVMATPGLLLDYETTRFYASATARLYRASGINHDFASARLGFSFFEAEYDQTQPWFVIEARRMRGLSEKTEVTPMLRLINRRYFVELGMNNSSQLRANFMYTY
ncbi:hypothetical protein ACFJGW_16425 [Burkholderiaceae bacterium UC74_6]